MRITEGGRQITDCGGRTAVGGGRITEGGRRKEKADSETDTRQQINLSPITFSSDSVIR